MTDARDVICCRSPYSFITAANIQDGILMVSSELFLQGRMEWTDETVQKKKEENSSFFWQGIPLTAYWKHHNIDPTTIDRKYVNFGLCAGRAKDVIAAYEWIIQMQFTDDQCGMAHYINEYPERIYMDTSATILHTSTSGVTGSYYNSIVQQRDSPTITELLGLSSYFLHIPGLSNIKGQLRIYTLCCSTVKQNMSQDIKTMHELYNLSPQNGYYYRVQIII